MPIASPPTPEWKRRHTETLAAAVLFGDALAKMYARPPQIILRNPPPRSRVVDAPPPVRFGTHEWAERVRHERWAEKHKEAWTVVTNPPETEFAIGRNVDKTPTPAHVSRPSFPNPFRRIPLQRKEAARDSIPMTHAPITFAAPAVSQNTPPERAAP